MKKTCGECVRKNMGLLGWKAGMGIEQRDVKDLSLDWKK